MNIFEHQVKIHLGWHHVCSSRSHEPPKGGPFGHLCAPGSSYGILSGTHYMSILQSGALILWSALITIILDTSLAFRGLICSSFSMESFYNNLEEPDVLIFIYKLNDNHSSFFHRCFGCWQICWRRTVPPTTILCSGGCMSTWNYRILIILKSKRSLTLSSMQPLSTSRYIDFYD